MIAKDDQIDQEPTQIMPGILYYRSIAEDSFNLISFPVLTKQSEEDTVKNPSNSSKGPTK